jgi:outer membrane receptor protein involved in Fe transport
MVLSRLTLCVLLLLLPALPAARAQDVDYAGLEQIFGEPVTISVTGKPQRVTEAPANITILTDDDIRRSGALTIPDLLAFVTGLYVRPSGIMSADVGMRGTDQMSNPRVLVLVDGREVYMPDFGRIEWATIPVQLAEIRQIEIIKGPNSALYGFNAASGVINIITTDPRHERVNVASVTGGTQNTAALSVVGTGKIGEESGVRLSAGGMRASDYAPGPSPPRMRQAGRIPTPALSIPICASRFIRGSRASSRPVSAIPACRRTRRAASTTPRNSRPTRCAQASTPTPPSVCSASPPIAANPSTIFWRICPMEDISASGTTRPSRCCRPATPSSSAPPTRCAPALSCAKTARIHSTSGDARPISSAP